MFILLSLNKLLFDEYLDEFCYRKMHDNHMLHRSSNFHQKVAFNVSQCMLHLKLLSKLSLVH